MAPYGLHFILLAKLLIRSYNTNVSIYNTFSMLSEQKLFHLKNISNLKHQNFQMACNILYFKLAYKDLNFFLLCDLIFFKVTYLRALAFRFLQTISRQCFISIPIKNIKNQRYGNRTLLRNVLIVQ